MRGPTRELLRDVAKMISAPVLTAFGTWALTTATGTGDSVWNVWVSDPLTAVVWTLGALALGISCGWAARGVRDRIRDEEGRRRREDEVREALTRAQNLVSLLNRREASMLLSMLEGNLEQDVFDTAIVGLLSIGAISSIAETKVYTSGEHMWMFQVTPEWRTYAKWERDLLLERASGMGEGA